MDTAFGILDSILKVLQSVWWIFLPIILFFPLRELVVVYVRDRSVKKIEWVLLEIKVPKDILKTPKAMEQVFAAMYGNYSHGLGSGLGYIHYKYVDGLIDNWFSFEMVGSHDGIHFYIYTNVKMRNLVESAVYSQYPDAEIHEAADYIELLPKTLPNKDYDLWGADLILGRESAYPIRTYPYFEETQEEKRLDPISALSEVMSNLKEGEWIWWQVVICPSDNSPGVDNKWKEEGDEIVAKIGGQAPKASPSGLGSAVAELIHNLFLAPFQHPEWGVKKEEKTQTFKFLSPAEQEVVKAIDNKTSKLGFDTTIRFIYFGKAEGFSSANATAVMGTIRQFNTQNLNFFKPGDEKTLLSAWKSAYIPFYEKYMMLSKKRKLVSNYRLRRLRSKMVGKYRVSFSKIITFNVEELATLYHFPTMLVEAPKLRKIESKRGGAPATLPIIKE